MQRVFATILCIAYLVIAPACFLMTHQIASETHTMHHRASQSDTIASHLMMYHAFTGADAYLYALFFLVLLSASAFLARLCFPLRYEPLRKTHRHGDSPPIYHTELLLWLARHTLAPPTLQKHSTFIL